MDKPEKIELNTALKNTTMFLSSEQIESNIADLIQKTVDKMKNQLSQIGSMDGLKSFINGNPKSIDMLITLLGISEEKFKRVVSWVRISMGYTFDSEWTPSATRNKLIDNEALLNDFCELFTCGYRLEKFTSIIPAFILEDFKIDENILARLNNDAFIRPLVKSKLQADYNGQCCNYYYDLLSSRITSILSNYGLEYQRDTTLPFFKGNVNVIEFNGRSIIIAPHYYTTTSSSQTKYADDFISKLYQSIRGRDEYILVNILDGAGWVGRAADYRKVYADCHYFLNLKTIESLRNIIEQHLKITAP
jgi:hypothetical protein